MDATLSPPKPNSLGLEQLELDHPGIKFCPGDAFMWSPTEKVIYYPVDSNMNTKFYYSLLHEIGHAILGHDKFTSDLSLVRIERAAWDEAVELGTRYGLDIPEDHVEQCLGTYRDWLHARSMCPNCHQCGLQTSKTAYKCIFCRANWQVSPSRLCRVTRRKTKIPL
jgi:hypothetical protein